MNDTLRHIFLADLTATLAAEGYDMGTGKYLQVQELLSRLPGDMAMERLRSLLCPLFARSPQEQEDFYDLFQQSLARAQAFLAAAQAPAQGHAQVREVRIWRNALLMVTALFSFFGGYLLDVEVFHAWRNPTIPLVMGSLLAAGYFVRRTVASRRKRRIWLAVQLAAIVAGVGLKQMLRPSPPETLPPEYREYAMRPGDTLVQNIRIPAGDSLLLAQLGSGASQGTDSVFGDYSVSERGRFTYIVRDTFNFFRDTILVESFLASARVDSTFFVVVLQPGLDELNLVKDTAGIALAVKTPPYSRPVNQLLPVPERAYLIKLYQRYAVWVKALLILLSGTGLWSLLQWRERRRRLLSVVVEERTKPPYSWKLRIDNTGDIMPGESAGLLLNLLRRRIRGDASALDIPASIMATVRRLGMAEFRYRRLTAPPDYLLLIDRQSPNDHRAMLFDWLCRRFQAQEAPLARFFFAGDVRLCFDEKHPEGIALRELQHRYGNARLLLIGHGHQLLSPLSGRLERWTSVLADWRRRALLSPMPVRVWGRREERLSELFTLMPASPQGWSAAIEQLDAAEPQHAGEWIKRMDDIYQNPILLEGDLVSSLRKHFSEPLLDWIAACAVYPLLQWELTLYLGEELSSPGKPLLQFDNLMALCRLPWFVAGRIPEAARLELIDHLASRGLEMRVRQALFRLFEQGAKPDPASVAYEEYRVNAALNELALSPGSVRKQALQTELAGFRAAGYPMDAVAFRYLKDTPGITDFTLPERGRKLPSWLRRMIAPAGLLKPSTLDKVIAWPLWILFAVFAWSFNPPFDPCGHKRPLPYEGLELCVGTPAEELFYNELMLKSFIKQGDTLSADSILGLSRTLFPACVSEDTIAFLKNVAVYYYNKGIEASIDFEIQSASRLDTAAVWPAALCYWFQKAYALELNGGGITDAAMLAAAGRCRAALPPDNIGEDLPVPADELKPIVIRGRVVDAGRRGTGLGGVQVGAGPIRTLSDKQGYYAIEFPADAEGTTLLLRWERNGYDPVQSAIRIRQGFVPPVVEMSRQSPKPDRLAIFRKGELMGLRDAAGSEKLPAEYNQIEYDAVGNWYRVEQRVRGQSVFGYADSRGQLVVPVRYLDIGPLKDGLVRARSAEGWGYLDATGQTVIPFRFSQAGDFVYGRAEVSLPSGRFTIDRTGNCIANCPAETPVAQSVRPTTLSFSGEVLLYFDENAPSSPGNSYDDLYAAYYSRRSLFEKEQISVQQNVGAGTASQGISRFFETEVQGGRDELVNRLRELAETLRAGPAPGEFLVLTIAGFSDTNERDAARLAQRRAESVEEWVKRYNNGFFQTYIKEGKLRVSVENRGDQGIRGKEPSEWLRSARQRRASVLIAVQVARK